MNPVAIFCRHGNTFNKGEKVFWVGRGEDMPLTEEGCRQAEAAAEAIAAAAIPVAQVISGPLQRTRIFAASIAAKAKLNQAARIDNRLDELDYGEWSGLSDSEIEERFGPEDLSAWRDRGERPAKAQFRPSEQAVRQEVESLLEELEQVGGLTVAVTSNGRLRELGRMLKDLAGKPLRAPGVSTGAACVLVFRDSRWHIVAWNIKPPELAAALARVS